MGDRENRRPAVVAFNTVDDNKRRCDDQSCSVNVIFANSRIATFQKAVDAADCLVDRVAVARLQPNVRQLAECHRLPNDGVLYASPRRTVQMFEYLLGCESARLATSCFDLLFRKLLTRPLVILFGRLTHGRIESQQVALLIPDRNPLGDLAKERLDAGWNG